MSDSPAARHPVFDVFANVRIAAMLALGFASGLPLALSTGTLQAWLTVDGIDVTTIGFFALAGLPYTFKFVWAPLLDRFEPPFLGRRRGWLVITQLGLAAACFLMATFDPTRQIWAMAGCAVAIAFLSASQDVVFDAYRSDLLQPAERGAGAAVSVFGYRIAMLVSGGLALILADQWFGWPGAFQAMGALFVLIAAITVFTPSVPAVSVERTPVRRELAGFVAMLGAGLAVWAVSRLLPLEALGAGRFGLLAWNTVALVASFATALWAARAVGFPSFVEPWDAFFDRRKAIWLLALIVLYKLGDAFAGSLTTTFLIRGVGFSATEVGSVNKVMGLSATIVGALLGGAWLAKRSLYNALLVFGIAQAVSNFGYWVLAVLPQDLTLMALAVGIENLCGGMGTAAFVAFLMALTDRRFSAAQYALLSALASVGRVYVGPASGVMVAAIGWPSFYLFTVLTALPGIALLWWLRDEVRALSPAPGATAAGED